MSRKLSVLREGAGKQLHEEEELTCEEAPNVGRKQCLFSVPGCDQELAVCRKGAVCCADGVGNPVVRVKVCLGGVLIGI